jgi:hypothetical protein
MMKVKVIKPGYGHKEGHILELNETDAGHLMAFGYAVPYVVHKIETRPVAPPEIRFKPLPHEEPVPETEAVAPPIIQGPEEIESKKPPGLFGRRGRRKKT